MLATFDGPARAIRCAAGLVDDLGRDGIEIRAGIHTGECELLGDDVAGMAVHIGARIAALAGSGEVLVSSTVKDLVAGSQIEFEAARRARAQGRARRVAAVPRRRRAGGGVSAAPARSTGRSRASARPGCND